MIATDEGLAALQPAWQRLYSNVAPQNPFLSPQWSLAWWRHMCPDSSAFVLAAWQGDDLAGLAPLRIEKKWGVRLLKFMQDGRSDYLGFLVSPEHAGVNEVLLNYLYRHNRSWDLLLSRQMCELFFDPGAVAVEEGFRRVDMNATVAPYLASNSDWAELCQSGPSQLHRIQRKVNKMSREGGTVERITGPEVADTAATITQVEANSWKAGTDAAKFQTPNEQKMLAEVLASLGERGEVEVWIARMDDLPVAYLLNFLSPERTFYYQGAYHSKYRKFSPGSVLHYYAMQRTWRDGPREYDFMMGGEPWKSDWTNHTRALTHIAVFPKSPRGYLAFAVLLGPRWYFRRFGSARAAYGYWRRLSQNLRLADKA